MASPGYFNHFLTPLVQPIARKAVAAAEDTARSAVETGLKRYNRGGRPPAPSWEVVEDALKKQEANQKAAQEEWTSGDETNFTVRPDSRNRQAHSLSRSSSGSDKSLKDPFNEEENSDVEVLSSDDEGKTLSSQSSRQSLRKKLSDEWSSGDENWFTPISSKYPSSISSTQSLRSNTGSLGAVAPEGQTAKPNWFVNSDHAKKTSYGSNNSSPVLKASNPESGYESSSSDDEFFDAVSEQKETGNIQAAAKAKDKRIPPPKPKKPDHFAALQKAAKAKGKPPAPIPKLSHNQPWGAMEVPPEFKACFEEGAVDHVPLRTSPTSQYSPVGQQGTPSPKISNPSHHQPWNMGFPEEFRDPCSEGAGTKSPPRPSSPAKQLSPVKEEDDDTNWALAAAQLNLPTFSNVLGQASQMPGGLR